MSNADTETQKNKLLATLQAFPGGNIYLLAPKATVAEGFALYHKNATTSFTWVKGHSCLTAKVGIPHANTVNLFLKQDSLSFSCTCGNWNKGGGCAHVVCALMTVKNLFQPAVFKQKEEDAEQREFLMACITGAQNPAVKEPEQKKKRRGFAIVLEKNDRGLEVSVSKDGERAAGFLYWSIPALRGLLLPPAAPSYIQTPLLIRYLKAHANRYPIMIRAGGAETEVLFDETLAYTTATELNAEEDGVTITRVCRTDGVEEAIEIFDRVAFHPESQRIGIIEEIDGWTPWTEYRKLTSEDGIVVDDAGSVNSFTVPLHAFQKCEFGFGREQQEEVMKRLILKKDGVASPLGRAVHTCRMTITTSGGEGFTVLRADCRLGNDSWPPSYSTFSFFDRLRTGLPPYLRARKRQKALCNAFFSLTGSETRTGFEKIIKTAFDEGDIDKHAMKREVRDLLRYYRDRFFEEEEQLRYHDDTWTLVRPDKRKMRLLYALPFELFGWDIVDRMPSYHEMPVDDARFHDALPLLVEGMQQHGIDCVLNDKPVTAARWEISIDATTRPDIDWFEIRPEIRCNGVALDEDAIQRLLAGQERLEQDGAVRLLDDGARQILRRIADMSRTARGKGKREREIVGVPRLQILDWLALRNAGVTVSLPPEEEEILQRLLHFERIEQKPLPQNLTAKLRAYQQDGYHWLAFLYEHRFGACLADDMGLGKTIQAISLLGGIKEGTVKPQVRDAVVPHLVVVPPSLLFNWEHELGKFYPGLKVGLYAGNDRKADFIGQDVVLTTYGMVRRDIDILEKQLFHIIIFDEAQAVKNIHAGATGAARRLQGAFKLTITGTPLENHLGEYYSIIDLAVPGLLGDYDAFKPLLKSSASPSLDRVIERTRPFILRRTKELVLKDLPPKTETDIYLDLTEQQKTLYQRTVEQVRSTIDEAFRTRTQAQANIIALTAILKLRQICVSPQLVAADLSGVSPKMDFLIDHLRELMEEGHSALVFSQFTSFLDILGDALQTKGIVFSRLDGSTPTAKRKTLVNHFQSAEGPSVFLLSLKAGGQGLNLTKATYVFHLDPWWNPAVENQASDRAHRIGQRSKVTITRLLMRHTIEEKMMELKKRKKALYEAIMNDARPQTRGVSITKSDFNFLLG